jgi:hypothetical protein
LNTKIQKTAIQYSEISKTLLTKKIIGSIESKVFKKKEEILNYLNNNKTEKNICLSFIKLNSHFLEMPEDAYAD